MLANVCVTLISYFLSFIDGYSAINIFEVRLGENNLESTDEALPHVDRKIETIIIHPQYESNG